MSTSSRSTASLRRKPVAPASARSPLVAPVTPEPAQLADDQASDTASDASYGSRSSSDVGVPPPASIAAAVHEVPSLLSQLVSGHTDEQVGTMECARARSGQPCSSGAQACASCSSIHPDVCG